MAKKDTPKLVRRSQQVKQTSKSKTKKKFWYLKYLFILGILGCVGLLVIFIWVDKRVAHSLETRSYDSISAILSTPLRISSLEHPSHETLKRYLEDRNYREVNYLPRVPGEYRFSPSKAEVFVREFEWLRREQYKPKLVLYDFDSGAIHGTGNEENPSLVLEPKIISTLGDGEQRASDYKKLDVIPEHVKNAVIAIEDERFYQHHGVDPVAILRAMARNVIALSWAQGGSTLTQQLAKNTLFTPEKTIGRKVLEMLAALSLERHLSKPEILEMYLNEIYLGQEGSVSLHGVAEASSAFYGKRIEDVSVAEAALLAGIIKAPSYYSPRKHFDRALEKKNLVLEKMNELGFLKQADYEKARAEKINIIQESRNKKSAQYFTTALEQELNSSLNVDAAVHTGISVYTGLSYEMQACADSTLGPGIEALEKKYPKLTHGDSRLEGGLIAIEPHSGLIRAWNGGRDYSENQFNHVNQAVRQIGSTIKPFLYITAMDANLNSYKVATVTSVLTDAPMKIEQVNQQTWVPENYDRTFHGDVTLRYAVENSLNLPAVYTAQKVGIPAFKSTLEKFRVADNIEPVPALALGAADTTLLRLTASYAALANGGRYVAPRLFVSVVDKDGEALGQSNIEEEQVADENAVYVLTDILKGVVERGTAKGVRALGYQRPAAGKTGTSNDTRDAWFIGFTPNLAVGVWIGFDDNSKLGYTGGTLAVPIWTKFMQCIQEYHEGIDFIAPPGVVTVSIDGTSLERATTECPANKVVKELYVRGTEPRSPCHLHPAAPIDEAPDFSDAKNLETPRRHKSFWDRIFD